MHRIGRLDIESARRRIVGEAFRELNLPQEDSAVVADHFSKLRIEKMYLMPEAVETLSRLHENGKELGLLTNGDSLTQRGKIKRFGLGNYFKCILVEGELGYGKPDERIFRKALEVMDSRPDETMMVGDSLQWDVAGPQAVGIRGIWYNGKGVSLSQDAKTKPFRMIRRLSELFDILGISINKS